MYQSLVGPVCTTHTERYSESWSQIGSDHKAPTRPPFFLFLRFTNKLEHVFKTNYKLYIKDTCIKTFRNTEIITWYMMYDRWYMAFDSIPTTFNGSYVIIYLWLSTEIKFHSSNIWPRICTTCLKLNVKKDLFFLLIEDFAYLSFYMLHDGACPFFQD